MRWLGAHVRPWESPLEAALAAYNWGLGHLRQARSAAILAGSGHSTSWAALETHVPAETRDYVAKILPGRARYATLLGWE